VGSNSSYWTIFAQKFHIIGPPFAPSPEDGCAMESAVNAWAGARTSDDPLRVLLLGMTPRIARMVFPAPTSMLAIDRCDAMVRHVWPHDVTARRQAIVADWHCPPVGNASQDVVIGDGALNCVRYQDGMRRLVSSVRRVLRSDGTFVVRCFVQPPSPEDPEDVMKQIADGPSFHHFKMRLLMALQKNSREGIAVNDVYRFWTSQNVDVGELAARTGWDPQEIQTMELHKGPNIIHTFPTLEEIREVLAPCFRTISVRIPQYCLGERCPLVTAKP